MNILGMDHVAIAIDNLEKYETIFEDIFDLKGGLPGLNSASKIRLTMYHLDNTAIELISPLGEDSAISKYIKERGPGIHHICLLVDNIEGAIEELKGKGLKLIDEQPRRGVEGSLIAFIHPDSTGGILIELKEII
jgi:methylmalonyl-CoA epimerase